MTQEYDWRDFKKRVNDYVAEVGSDEAQEVIHDGRSHVSIMWEDGEVCTTKAGDLFGHRRFHIRMQGFLPDYLDLWDTGDSDHKKKVVTDKEVLDVFDNATVKIDVGEYEQTHSVVIEVDDE